MLIRHEGRSPVVHQEAYVAPNAAVVGDVRIGARARILFGAQVVAEGGAIEIGDESIVMENAVLRSTARHSLSVGANCLIGPNAHVVGCTLESNVFVATGAAIFHGSHVALGCEVRINGVVHLRTRLDPSTVVPTGWVAVGDPARILPPDEHEAIWEMQRPLDFPLTVYGIDRAEADTVSITRTLSASLATHFDDVVLTDNEHL